ncbi:hypothetical protein GJAV_G00171350 [Gymnothorax javanicus]|nr:hypothetical protein GJAV_G00171350 [Gymnothorax javanicus]
MGHVQCVSRTPEKRSDSHQARGGGLDRSRCPTSRSRGASMILPTLIPEKSPAPIWPKEQSVEARRGGSAEDSAQVERALSHLQESGWYWGSITAAEAKHLLSEAKEGCFLLRNSSNPAYLFTLSVQTSLGPTHLRIEMSGGTFGFDSLALARPRLRRFGGVVELVQHYALACAHSAPPQNHPIRTREEMEATRDRSLQLRLLRPLPRTVPRLQHLCRVVINQLSQSHPPDPPVPTRLKTFLQEYPFLL